MLRSVSLSLPRSAVVLLVVLLSRSLVRGGLLSPDKEGSNKDVGSLPGIQAAITGKGLKYCKYKEISCDYNYSWQGFEFSLGGTLSTNNVLYTFFIISFSNVYGEVQSTGKKFSL